ncbi:hypothetical protein [Agriterribacter sp.]|uniref:hypothetical protein n=1 Tax=Agriterribacter sp. TaxID=2821509 RepID=UPI002C7285FE|nr:hypothetical protein [Agriterribacter sp.]HRO45323.1 hypothetical protein [Agriterribacter sp.]HRQ17116.1 hypothetical protein [Agriterribacter sp.]
MKSPAVFILLLSCISLLACKNKNAATRTTGIASIADLRKGDMVTCGPAKQQFGNVAFALSAAENVKDTFNLALSLLHSFEYEEAEKAFAKVIDMDPRCAMAYWGVAMSNFHPLWSPPNKEELEKGAKASEIAASLKGENKRENEYIDAIYGFFHNWQQLNHRTRAQQYEQAMEKIRAGNPGDKEAAIFYALALNATADPTDKTYTHQKKAGEILNALYPGQPGHPGIVHYIIHTYDYPELAEKALPAARKYASIAPSSAHALHMPSHIFTRLGLWNESIQSNLASADAARCYAENLKMKDHPGAELHAMDYLVYAYLQNGQEEEAKTQVDYLQSVAGSLAENNSASYASAAIPARYALELRYWEAAADLDTGNAAFSSDRHAWEKAIVHFARVMGGVHTGRLKAAKNDLRSLRSLQAALLNAKDDYKAKQVLVQIKAAEAWICYAEGKKKEALALMTEAANMEDSTEKHPVTPGEVIPARELEGDLLLLLGKNREALRAYETSMTRCPNRRNSLKGAVLAAERSGNKAKAAAYVKQLNGR